MAKGWSTEIKGMKELQAKLKQFPQKLKEEADIVFADGANEMVNRAVADAPRDMGFLVNQITMERQGEMNYRVVSGGFYAGYIEFGTRERFVNPYPELNAFASALKGGKGSGGGTLFSRIKEWVKRKGIPPEAVYPIWKSIITRGIHPHPYFFKNYFKAVKDIMDGIKDMIKNMK